MRRGSTDPGALTMCERRLQDRACRLDADAVILTELDADVAVPPGASKQLLVARTGRAIRYDAR
jgi:hypothetical protein